MLAISTHTVLYCLPVWGPSLSDASVNCLKRLQNRAIRLCMGLRKYDHVSCHFCILNWLPVRSMIQYCTLCAVYIINIFSLIIHQWFHHYYLDANTNMLLVLHSFLLSHQGEDYRFLKDFSDLKLPIGGMLLQITF